MLNTMFAAWTSNMFNLWAWRHVQKQCGDVLMLLPDTGSPSLVALGEAHSSSRKELVEANKISSALDRTSYRVAVEVYLESNDHQ